MPMFSLDSTLHSLKCRMLAIGGTAGFAWGGVAAIALVLVGVWLDLVWELSAAARLSAIVISSLAGASLAIRLLIWTTQGARDLSLVRRLDETGRAGGQIVSGFELQSVGGAATLPTLTSGLAELAVARAAELAAQVPHALAVPFKPAYQALTGTVGLVAGLGLVALVSPRLAATEFLRFIDPYGDHPPFSLTLLHVEPGDTHVRYGTGLDVFVSTEGAAVEQMDLVLLPDASSGREEKLPMFPESPQRWRATVSSVTSAGRYFARAGSARSHRYRYEVITVPLLEEVRFRITPPAYTRDAVYEGPMPQTGLSGLAGSIVEVRARSNRPLSGGTVQFTHGDGRTTIRLEPATADHSSHEVAGSLTMRDPGTFELNVTDIAGQESLDSMTGTITILKDRAPFARLVEPAPQSLATPTVTLPVTIGAEDDYGITRLQLFRSLNDSRAIPLTLPADQPPSRRQEARTYLPLASYGLQPGDVIKLFARVEDNDPAGAKGAESPVAVIQIVSDEDFQRMLRTREGMEVLMSKYQEAERRLESIEEEIEQLQKKFEKRDPDGPLSQDEHELLERLMKRIESESNAVRESSKHLLPYDLDESLSGELDKLADQLDQAAEAAGEAGSNSASAGETAKRLAEMKQKLAAKHKKFKQGLTDPLDRLAAIYPLLEDQHRFVELCQRQRDLAERLASIKGEDGPGDPAMKARMRDLEFEQRKNREDLEQLLNEIESHAARVPLDETRLVQLVESAREFVEAVRNSGAEQSMTLAEGGLAEFSGSRGHEAAKNAAEILEKFLSRCQGMGDGAGEACEGLKFNPGEGSLGETLSQLLADAGMKPGGSGAGKGSGGGYSARRSTLNNMGLYGNIPTRGNPKESGNGNGKRAGGTGGSYQAETDAARANRGNPQRDGKASGASEAFIPPRYRDRVEQYFRRIAEETSGK